MSYLGGVGAGDPWAEPPGLIDRISTGIASFLSGGAAAPTAPTRTPLTLAEQQKLLGAGAGVSAVPGALPGALPQPTSKLPIIAAIAGVGVVAFLLLRRRANPSHRRRRSRRRR